MTVTDRGALGAPPHDPDAERAVLGAMLLSPDAVATAIDLLDSGDFYAPVHAELFTVMVELYATGSPVDGATLGAAARTRGMLPRLSNGAYISELMAAPGSPASVSYYAHIIVALARLRRVAEASLRGFHMASAVTADPDTVPGQVADAVVRAATAGLRDQSVTAGQAADDAVSLSLAISRGEVDRRGLSTGYPDLDALTFGIHPGQLILVAGRPAMGKSVVLLDIARHVAVTQGRPVLLCSLEMSTLEVGQRLVAATSGVPLKALREGTMSAEQELKALQAQSVLAAAPLIIDESTDVTVADLRAKALSASRRSGGLALIAVDYLQLITPLNPRADKHVQIGDISRGLKVLAKDIAPVVSASQLNRGPEQRTDKKPLLSDLRDSGALEQDCDVAILLHRDDYYEPESPRAGEVDLIVAKQRNGPVGTVSLAGQFTYARLVSMYHPGA